MPNKATLHRFEHDGQWFTVLPWGQVQGPTGRTSRIGRSPHGFTFSYKGKRILLPERIQKKLGY